MPHLSCCVSLTTVGALGPARGCWSWGHVLLLGRLRAQPPGARGGKPPHSELLGSVLVLLGLPVSCRCPQDSGRESPTLLAVSQPLFQLRLQLRAQGASWRCRAHQGQVAWSLLRLPVQPCSLGSCREHRCAASPSSPAGGCLLSEQEETAPRRLPGGFERAKGQWQGGWRRCSGSGCAPMRERGWAMPALTQAPTACQHPDTQDVQRVLGWLQQKDKEQGVAWHQEAT